MTRLKSITSTLEVTVSPRWVSTVMPGVLATDWLSLYQLMEGEGVPLDTQFNVTMSPTVPESFPGATTIAGGTIIISK